MSRTHVLFGSIALGSLLAGTLQASELRILQADPFQLSAPTRAGSANQKLAAAATTVSVAGREFHLTLESNEQLLRSVPAGKVAALGEHELYRGEIAGVTGSWVRISRINGRTYGAMWDGVELYAIGPRADVEAKMGHPLNSKDAEAAIFRWSDTEGGDVHSCGLAGDIQASNGERSQALLRELKTESAATGSQQIAVAVVGDYEFYSLFG